MKVYNHYFRCFIHKIKHLLFLKSMSFSGIWRQECGCCDDTQDIDIPNITNLSIYGFLYRNIPDLFTTDDLKILPLKFEVDYYNLMYFFKFSKPKNNKIKLCLSDDIIPIVISNNKELKVSRLYNKNNYYYYLIYLN